MKANQVIAAIAVTGAAGLLVVGCGGAKSASGTSATKAASSSASTAIQVLPVPSNPISNSSTAAGLTITKVLVENNVSPSTGKAVDDHLEIALKNTSATTLTNIEVYYKITDPSKHASEGYYTKLTGFDIKPGATRTAHFDNTGAPDHFPDNKYSLYRTDKNALVVDVMASSPAVKPATFTVHKDAGGAEAGVE